MNALLNSLEHLLKLAGFFVLALMLAWAVVSLGLLADTTYLLHTEKRRPAAVGGGQRRVHIVGRKRFEPKSKRAA